MKFSIAVSILLSASSAAAFQARSASSGVVSRMPLHAVAMDPFTIAAAPKARQERVEIDMTGVALSVSMPLAEARINSLLTALYHFGMSNIGSGLTGNLFFSRCCFLIGHEWKGPEMAERGFPRGT